MATPEQIKEIMEGVMRVVQAQQGASTPVDKGKSGRGIDERAFKRLKEFDGE